MQLRNRILCSIFGFFLMLALLIPQLILPVQCLLLSQERLYNYLCTEENAQQTIELVVDDSEFVADSCGLSHAVFDGVFAPEHVVLDMEQALSAAQADQVFVPDTTEIMSVLAENVRNNLRELEETDDVSFFEDDIASFCKQIDGIYQDYINLKVYDYLTTIDDYASMGISAAWLVCGVLCLLTIVMIWLLLRKWSLFLREVAYSFFGAGGLMAILSVYLLISAPFSRIMLAPLFLRETIRRLFYETTIGVLTASGITLCIACLLFAVAAILHRRNNRKSRIEESDSNEMN